MGNCCADCAAILAQAQISWLESFSATIGFAAETEVKSLRQVELLEDFLLKRQID